MPTHKVQPLELKLGEEIYFSTDAVADLVGIAAGTLKAYRGKGIGIPYTKLSNHCWYAATDIALYMKNNRTEVA